MSQNLPVPLYPTSVILDSIISHILLAESPIDARLTAQNGPAFHLSCEHKGFSLEYLEKIMFVYMIEHHQDISLLEQLCGIEGNLSTFKKMNYIELYYKIDEHVEIDFIHIAKTHKIQTRRYKLLAAIDALISIGNLIVLQKASSVSAKPSAFLTNKNVENTPQCIFLNTAMLMRNLSLIYNIDKRQQPLVFRSPTTFVGLRPEKPGHSQNFDRFRSQYSEYMQEALKKREEALNISHFELINCLFQNIKSNKSQLCSLGGQHKAYKNILLDAMGKFMRQCPCSNLTLFKKYFFEAHTENTPLHTAKQNSFYINSEDMLFYRSYFDFSNKERNDVVPDSTLEELFKNITTCPRHKKKNKSKLRN